MEFALYIEKRFERNAGTHTHNNEWRGTDNLYIHFSKILLWKECEFCFHIVTANVHKVNFHTSFRVKSTFHIVFEKSVSLRTVRTAATGLPCQPSTQPTRPVTCQWCWCLWWKLSTNMDKLQLISISIRQPNDVIVNNHIIPFNNNCKILGFTFNSRGFVPHIRQRLFLANNNLRKLKRFKGLSTKSYLYLYKTLVRPILEYPAVLLSLTKKTNLSKLQAVQNKALRRAFGDSPPYYSTIKELHTYRKLEPLNVRFHRLGNKSWKRLCEIDNTIPEASIRLNNRGVRQHSWWRRLSSHLLAPAPRPRYIR